MPLTTETSQQLQEIAQNMISEKVNQKRYLNFGTLVRKKSDDFENFANEIVLGEIKIDNDEFVFFGK